VPEYVVIAATGTEVGKTWCAVRLIQALRVRGIEPAARKPVQSFEPGTGRTDAELLAGASGESSHEVCPPHRWYETPLAPPMAAQDLRRPEPLLGDLVREVRCRADLVVVEGVGGVRSPLAIDGDTGDLARALGARQVVLVARSDLGTINDVRLAEQALGRLEVIVLMNRFDPCDGLHRRNRDWLRHYDGFDVHTGIASIAERLLARHTLEVT
jgi:dethiobiotin synthetase